MTSDFPPSYILTPYNSTLPPTISELSARFPDWPAEDIEALMKDHEDEIQVLEAYLDGNVDLEKRVREVAELVRRDYEMEEGGDDGDIAM
jgi:nuclear pore complex protein Nup133